MTRGQSVLSKDCICGNKAPLYCSYQCAKYAEGIEDIKQILFSLSEVERIRIADMILEMDYFSLKEIARDIVYNYNKERGNSD